MAEPEETQRRLEIRGSNETARPLYSDLAQVRHDPEGFLLDFYMMEPEDQNTGWSVVRIRVGHRMAIRLAEALNQNLNKWANKELKVRGAETDLLEDLAAQSPTDFSQRILQALELATDDPAIPVATEEPAAKEA